MKDLLSQIEQLKNYTNETIKIPFNYLVFSMSLLLYFRPILVSTINAISWLPKEFTESTLIIFDLLFSHTIFISISIILLILSIAFLADHTTFFSTISQYINRETRSWNHFSAIKRLLNLLFNFFTNVWIYYFFINVLLNKISYKGVFLSINSKLFLDMEPSDMRNIATINAFLFLINTLCLIYYYVEALFCTTPTTDIYQIPTEKMSHYIKINYFVGMKADEPYEFSLLKEKYYVEEPKYYLAKTELSLDNSVTLYQKSYYVILDSSKDLSNIIYHFDSLKQQYELLKDENH